MKGIKSLEFNAKLPILFYLVLAEGPGVAHGKKFEKKMWKKMFKKTFGFFFSL